MVNDDRQGLVESLIRAAQARGDFDDLPGRGHPLPLDDLAGLDAEARFEARLLRVVGELPREVYLMREVRACRTALAGDQPIDERVRLEKVLRAKLDELMAALKARRLMRPVAGAPFARR